MSIAHSSPTLLHSHQYNYVIRSVTLLFGNDKECSNYHTIALISHANKVMLKLLQVRLQQYVN